MTDTTVPDFDVLIVGAGISGIGMAAHLEMMCPDRTYGLLERREKLGGTWDLFRYPGIRSDSDMHTLGFAFEPWTHEKSIADGPAILEYLHRIADERLGRRRDHPAMRAAWQSRLRSTRATHEQPRRQAATTPGGRQDSTHVQPTAISPEALD